MLDQKIELLQQVPLFSGLSEDLLERSRLRAKRRFFEAGETLIAKASAGSTAYLIMTGKAGCPKIGGEAKSSIEDLWPGTLVGELACWSKRFIALLLLRRNGFARSPFNRDAFRGVMEEHPALAQHIAEKLLVRLHGLAAEIRKVDSKLDELEKAA